MIPTTNTVMRLGVLLAGDPASLAIAGQACKVALITNDFAESNGLLAGQLTPCTVTGMTALSATVGTQNQSVDPLTGELIVEMKAPVGGWRFNPTTDVGLPVMIYGFALFNAALSILWGSTRFATPRNITAPEQSLTLPEVTFRIDPRKIR